MLRRRARSRHAPVGPGADFWRGGVMSGLADGTSSTFPVAAVAVSTTAPIYRADDRPVAARGIAFRAHELRDDIKVRQTPEAGAQQAKVQIQVRRTEQVQDRRVLIEQHLDVDQLDVPTRLVKNLAAGREPVAPQRLGAVPARQVIEVGDAYEPRTSGIAVKARRARQGTERKQHLAEFQTPISTQHDGLSALGLSPGLSRPWKSPHVPHQAVTHEIAWRIVHGLSLGVFLEVGGAG